MRIDALQQYLRENELCAALFFNLDTSGLASDYFYFTQTQALGVALITKHRRYIFTPRMEWDKLSGRRDFTIHELTKKQLDRKISQVVRNSCASRIGLNLKDTSVSRYREIKSHCKSIKDISSLTEELRNIKTGREISLLKKAGRLTDQVFETILQKIPRCGTESDIAAEIIAEIYRRGCTPSFTPIIASGKNAALPHHDTSTKALRRGFMIMDFGLRYRGYCSDITRTVFLGSPTRTQREIYQKLYQAQVATINKARAGTSIAWLDQFSRSIGDYPTSLGHGLGIDVHEAPRVNKNAAGQLKEGMALTIEPGIYVTNRYGLRLEDDLVITQGGPKVLTNCTKELITIQPRCIE